ncbi:GH92 family glycosyl hydrolase [Sphingobacterium yanglingense]|uniref:Putative alpha-1,2-mannosidase n=1 Tax=Sphingobacterium yanglingense TaxID=1437280 RepID=A0A4V3DDC2_9SPHI|nr:GH92 family glycosyl hydrolase [Sphingobacterium yanglingense]TDQ75730.1 putative alpha-1,2-mannosidase [Sphingobacterium yanglingense]
MITKTSKAYFSAAFILLGLGTSNAQQVDYTQYVDPHIGSAEHGHVFVGANVPSGAVQLGPSQIAQTWDKFNGWDWCSGYNYKSEDILGFTHTHLSGTGIGDLNDLLILPATGKHHLSPAPFGKMDQGYGSTISKANETVRPGYYKVLLEDYGILAEMTSSERVGYHRYTFQNKNTPHLLIDLGFQMNWDKATDTYLKLVDEYTLVGYRFSKGWADDQKVYFAIKSSTSLKNTQFYNGNKKVNEYLVAKGAHIKAIIDIDAGKPVELKVGLSPVSVENALDNIQREIPGWSFDQAKSNATRKWNETLGKIDYEADPRSKTIFYTALYHSYFAPTIFNDANGDYMGTDKQVHRQENFENYTLFSLWDTYRGLHPLMTLLEDKKNKDYIKTMLKIYQQQGKLPVWHLWGNETNTMVGLPAIPVIADALLKGFIDPADQELAFEAVKTTAMGYENGLRFVRDLSYIPIDSMDHESVAWALEYAIADFGAYKMAKYLNKDEDARYFEQRYKLYEKYFDKEVGHFVGRHANGNFRRPFDPLMAKHRENDYCEGNAWQYTWLVPHDVNGLMQLFGGEQQFVNKLDEFIQLPEVLDDASPDISGMVGQYAQGNEPNHHVPYLYAYAGQQWKGAALVHKAMTKYYTDQPNGLCGNDDAGQMSAWYVFSSMGIYPANPMDGKYVFGSPLMKSAKIALGNGKTFKIVAKNQSKDNIYIQRAMWNGKTYDKSYITHDMIMAGGELEFEMGAKPNKKFGQALSNRP